MCHQRKRELRKKSKLQRELLTDIWGRPIKVTYFGVHATETFNTQQNETFSVDAKISPKKWNTL